MPKTFRVSITGGIDAVTDIGMGDGRHVAYMENLDVRGGKAKPFNLPRVNANVVVPAGSTQVYAYRSRILFSDKRRDYAAEYVDSRERIYWTEYGGNPEKMVEGTVVPLGTTTPDVPPSASIGTYVAPNNIVVTVASGGTLAKDTPVTFRLAYQTAFGVLPPSGIIKPTISADGSKITLSWSNPTMDNPATQILVFIGNVGGDEKYLATIGAKSTSFIYTTVQTASGALASTYDQALSYQYCTTYVRNVNGVQDESGPSAPTPPILAATSRQIDISPWGEGILDSPNTIEWTHNFRLVDGQYLPGAGVGLALSVLSITEETQSGRVLCAFATESYFCDGDRILITGFSPDPFSGIPVEIEVEADMEGSCYLVVGESFTPPGAGSGTLAYQVTSVDIDSMQYNAESGVVEINTVTAHTFGSEKVTFAGFADKNWSGQIPVIPDPNNAKKLFVEGKALPSDTVFTTCTITRSRTAVALSSAYVGVSPILGDVLYFDMTTTTAVKEAHAVIGAPVGVFIVNAAIVGAGTTSGTVYSSGFSFVPNNDYLTHRRIYRAGGTTNFQLVKELKMDVLSFLDAIPDSGLGVVLPTFYTENDVDVLVQPAPFGLAGLTQHYGMGFAFDPSSNRLRWTIPNFLDAWPPEFYRDFEYRILALASFNQALCVFTDNGVYRIEGTQPTLLQRHITKAAPCRAGGSVQFLNNRIIYLSDQGIMAFDGQESVCLTDIKIPGDFWLGTSRYLDNSEPGCYLVPFTQNAAYERLLGPDTPAITPRNLMPYMVQHANQIGIRSFIKYGKYFLYWGGDYPQYEAQTMLCIDFSAEGAPITIIGIKAVDAFVDETERVHMLLSVGSA